MKILFVFTHHNFWSPLDPIARTLVEKGNQVTVLIDRQRNRKFESRYPFKSGGEPYQQGWSLPRGDGLQFFLYPLRHLISYIAYFKLRTPTSHLLVARWSAYLPFFLKPFIRFAKVREWLTRDVVWNFLLRMESKTPIDLRIKRHIRSFMPDVLIAASAIQAYSQETDYLKAAQQIGIPTILIIPSWDNLTTKGTLHATPDHLFVWNKYQSEEAEKLHHIPREQVFCTGAAKFDLWFKTRPALDRNTFYERLGMKASKPYLLYLCSSEFIGGDETAYINQLAERIERDVTLKDLMLLVRPHPQNLRPWTGYKSNGSKFLVWPLNQQSLAPEDMIQDYYHSLLYSIGVAGINTSAFIEAAIVDKPGIAITSESYTYTQMGIPHFQHLLNADFLEIAATMDQTVQILERWLKGHDPKREKRREFVHDFVRPRGVTTPVQDVVLRAIENVAMKRSPAII